MTVFVIGLVVTVFLFVLALVQGVTRTLSVTASTRNILTMRVGLAGRDAERHHAGRRPSRSSSLPGIERSASGRALRLAGADQPGQLPRGGRQDDSTSRCEAWTPIGFAMRPGVKIVDGRMFAPGTNEAIVSKNLAKRFAGMKIGDTIKTGSFRWMIVGHFDASGSAYESEIWTDAKDLQGADQAQDLLVDLRAHERSGCRRRDTSRRSRATRG